MKVLRALFLVLVAGNLLMFAHGQGYLGSPVNRGEPDRIANQLHPERLRIASPAVPGPGAVSAAPPASACREFASLAPESALRLAEAVRPMADSVRLSQRVVEPTPSYWVFIPPAPNRQEAERKLAVLKRLEVRDYYLVQDPGPNQFAISLGLYRSMESATEALAGLRKAGVATAQIAARQPATQVVVRLEGPADTLAALEDRLRAQVPGIAGGECRAGT